MTTSVISDMPALENGNRVQETWMTFSPLSACNGLIIDIRNNTGGLITSAEEPARFTNKEILVGYIQHKTGNGQTTFPVMRNNDWKPSSGLPGGKRMLSCSPTDSVFSAANEFVK